MSVSCHKIANKNQITTTSDNEWRTNISEKILTTQKLVVTFASDSIVPKK
jgi:hypothetical protein